MVICRSPRVYLAGPDVFLPNAVAWGQRKKTICAQYGLTGVTPLDKIAREPDCWASLQPWQVIGRRNEVHIRSSDAMIANITPFRGPSADVGTVFEIGFMRALGRPIFAYATVATPFTERTLASIVGGVTTRPDGETRDADDMQVERFGRFDNLMIDAGIAASGGRIVTRELPRATRWNDLSVFESCVLQAAAELC